MTRTLRLAVWVGVVAMAVTPTELFAQRRPSIPPGQAKRVQQVPGTSGLVSDSADTVAGTPASISRVRTLGSWLDDATVVTPGEAWLALSASRWSMPIATGGDAPVIDVTAGLTPRVQASLTVPYFRATDRAGGEIRGLGDLYVGGKVVLRDPSSGGIGVAVGPTLEVLSATSVSGTGLNRVNWIFPLNLEHRLDTGRLYGSTGYFSRGVFFTSGAYEYPIAEKASLAIAATHAYSTDRNAASEELGLRRQRVDVSGTGAFSVSPALSLFGSLGRTVWGFDPDSTRWLASVGVAVNVRGG